MQNNSAQKSSSVTPNLKRQEIAPVGDKLYLLEKFKHSKLVLEPVLMEAYIL